MTIGPKGYQATQQRVGEILARVKTLRPEGSPAAPSPRPVPLQGQIGKSNGYAPLDPFGPATNTTVSRPAQELLSLIQSAAQRQNLDPVLFESLVHAESNFDPGATSPKGAIGLTQLMPATARSLGVTDPYDPGQNLEGGAKYLAAMLRQFNGDERLALAAYNAGPGAVLRHNGVPPFNETERYVSRIMARVASLRGAK